MGNSADKINKQLESVETAVVTDRTTWVASYMKILESIEQVLSSKAPTSSSEALPREAILQLCARARRKQRRLMEDEVTSSPKLINKKTNSLNNKNLKKVLEHTDKLIASDDTDPALRDYMLYVRLLLEDHSDNLAVLNIGETGSRAIAESNKEFAVQVDGISGWILNKITSKATSALTNGFAKTPEKFLTGLQVYTDNLVKQREVYNDSYIAATKRKNIWKKIKKTTKKVFVFLRNTIRTVVDILTDNSKGLLIKGVSEKGGTLRYIANKHLRRIKGEIFDQAFTYAKNMAIILKECTSNGKISKEKLVELGFTELGDKNAIKRLDTIIKKLGYTNREQFLNNIKNKDLYLSKKKDFTKLEHNQSGILTAIEEEFKRVTSTKTRNSANYTRILAMLNVTSINLNITMVKLVATKSVGEQGLFTQWLNRRNPKGDGIDIVGSSLTNLFREAAARVVDFVLPRILNIAQASELLQKVNTSIDENCGAVLRHSKSNTKAEHASKPSKDSLREKIEQLKTEKEKLIRKIQSDKIKYFNKRRLKKVNHELERLEQIEPQNQATHVLEDTLNSIPTANVVIVEEATLVQDLESISEARIVTEQEVLSTKEDGEVSAVEPLDHPETRKELQEQIRVNQKDLETLDAARRELESKQTELNIELNKVQEKLNAKKEKIIKYAKKDKKFKQVYPNHSEYPKNEKDMILVQLQVRHPKKTKEELLKMNIRERKLVRRYKKLEKLEGIHAQLCARYNTEHKRLLEVKGKMESTTKSTATITASLKSIDTIKERGSIASFRIPQTEEHIDSVSYAIKTQDVKYKKL